MRLKNKILIVLLMVGILPLALAGIVSYQMAKNQLEKEIFAKLEAVNSIKQIQMRRFFKNVKMEVEAIAESSDTTNIYNVFKTYHDEMNTLPEGNYDVANQKYQNLWSKYIPLFEKLQKKYDYYDIFLICKDHGHVMFTLAKESDIGENLSFGQYKDTHLATLWKKVSETEQYYITDTKSYAPSNGDPAMFAGFPLKIDGQMVGVFGVQISIAPINKIMSNRTGMGKTGESYLVGSDLLMRSDSYLDPKGHSVKASFKHNNRVNTDAAKRAFKSKRGVDIISDYNGSPVLSSYNNFTFNGITWAILSEIDEAEAFAAVEKLRNIILGLVLVVSIILVFVGIFMGKNIMAPVNKIIAILKEITSDALAGKEADPNEVGIDFREVIEQNNLMLDSFVRPIKESMAVMKKLAGKDLTARATGEYKGQINDFKNDINRVGENLLEAMEQVTTSCDQINTAGSQVAGASVTLSQGTTEQASSLEEITSSMNEIDSQTKQNAENAKQAQALSKESTQGAQDGNNKMREMVDAMGDINKSSESIGKIIKVIDEIAFQTNLLALNAAVEAARAGKHGKGFAVVAEEVRNLAQRSAKAAKETNDLIDNSSKKVEFGNKISQETAKTLEIILEGTSKVTDLVDEIATASNDQSQGISQVVSALNEIDKVTQGNAANSEQSAAAAEELSAQAKQLQAIVSEFKIS